MVELSPKETGGGVYLFLARRALASTKQGEAKSHIKEKREEKE